MITVAEVRNRLGSARVDEEANAEYRLVYLYVRPTRAGLEPIYFCLDEDRSFIQQFGFGEWHYHPHEINDAVETARLLVCRERCVVEQRDANGKCRGSGLFSPDGLPDTLSMDTASLRRVFFDQEPVAEVIDFDRYFQGKHLRLSHERKAEAERMYRELGMAVPDW